MRFLKNNPVFLFLLPLFFILHGFVENYNAVQAKDAILLLLLYIGCSIAITFLLWLAYRDLIWASLIACGFMAYHFFFGTMQDLLKEHFAGTFFSRYSFILPLSTIFFLALFIWLKKNKHLFKSLLLYLNYLLLLFITIDAAWLFLKAIPVKTTEIVAGNNFEKCTDCKKPDIYFIILDEYTGNTALKDHFSFDNSGFEHELQRRGFHTVDSGTSNYNYTPFSIASMLNMSYLNLNMKTKGPGNLNYCYRTIRDSRVLKFLETNDYKFYNHSIFDFNGQPSINEGNFLPTSTALITSQTFLSRIWKDVLFNVSTGKWNIRLIQKKIIYAHLYNNENFTRLSLDVAAKKTSSPKFVYTHLMMPHHPYYFDSNGNALPFDSLLEGRQYNKQNYTEYLQYCNKKLLLLTDSILIKSASPPIIIFSGDHGFRYFREKVDRKYYFMNFLAVYFPDGNYNGFYNTMSSVNLFPIILNTELGQHVSLQKDSSIYLWD